MSFDFNALVGGLGVALQLFGAGKQAKGAFDGAQAERAALSYQATLEDEKAGMVDERVRDAYIRGSDQVFRQGLKTAQVRGSQRARFAARGVALNEGSAAAILADTDYFHDMDVRTIADNTEREAWALRQQARSARMGADLLRARAGAVNPNMSAASSLLSSGARVAESWYRLKAGKGEASPLTPGFGYSAVATDAGEV